MNRDLGVWTSEDCALVLIAGLDAGITLIDTGDFYGTGHNELLFARALKGRDSDSLLLSVKFGALRDPTGGWGPCDGRPAAVKSFLANPLTRLSPANLDRIEAAVPAGAAAGWSYTEFLMGELDSERSAA
jgi:aryl-alcohol dehydrogenase-like predicted oxidoreductase